MKKVLFLGLVLLAATAVSFGSHIVPTRVIAEIVDCENGHCEVIEIKDDAKSEHCEDGECVPNTEDASYTKAGTYPEINKGENIMTDRNEHMDGSRRYEIHHFHHHYFYPRQHGSQHMMDMDRRMPTPMLEMEQAQ